MRWWIDKPKLIGSHNPRQAELNIENLSTIVSLIDPSEASLKYNPAIPGIKWVEIPVRDYHAPSIENLKRFVRLVEDSPKTVLVHCQGGSGRTGTFGGAWLIYSRGLRAAEAIDMLREENACAVETDEQEAVLVRFEKLVRKGF
ncbi:hypothetical protein CSA37_01015 [Candidatus Fermentibacteria bacterium]|nr:MAG: hypothetical protein CSA37_01015 [Candidatus Fermentibacteria bacterium]